MNAAHDSNPIRQAAGRVLANNYPTADLVIERADGARVVDVDGREYIDLGTGISVTSFGHGHPRIRAALHAQLDTLWHVSNLYYSEQPVRLAEELVASCFAERVFLCNSGSEANEAAIKLVRKGASATRAPDRRVILTFEGGFHGRTLAAVTATAQPKYHAGFEPLPSGFRYAPFNDVAALDRHFDDSVCAVLVEPVQGEGGIHVATPDFLRRLRELCDAHGAFLIVDEVQSGMGRCGRLWAHQWTDVVPDCMTSAKALGAGLPIGAVMIGAALAETFVPGSHGSTFGGNPVVCAGARVALSLAQDADLLRNVQRQGQRLRTGLERIGETHDAFDEIRGRGLMLGAQLRAGCVDRLAAIVSACREHGVIVLPAGGGVLRLLPPLVIDDDTLDEALRRLEAGVADGLRGAGR